MAAQSNMLALGTALPHFSLECVTDGTQVDTAALPPRPVLVMFLCNHCPYVVHVRERVVALANEAVARGMSVVAINSNSERSHPEDGPTNMRDLARAMGFHFPFVFDRTQEVARAFDAVCTPEFYVFDASHALAYRGRFDASSPKNGQPVTGNDLRAAIDAVLAGERPSSEQLPSIGCSIKWEPPGAGPHGG